MTMSSDRAVPGPLGDEPDVETGLLRFLELRTGRAWSADTDVFGSGGLSSLFAMELVVHLERTYGVSVRGADLQMENFRTVRRMTDLVARLRRTPADGTGG
ncbi:MULTISPECIES: acyl carrier protein [Streptomyces]|uniref:Acyl carrier protein n=1 Tax=Streptomyces doudnae TaxID=3075536 RepID=A0ABD5EP65_9ACTN|nr:MULTISPECIES: acyl carrier protein [unclassified Streptomyces]MDT0436493.1 acyl carrier protein [Streptomyces sp. DSM 41981]MYQ67710.1 acyl carrier protein [Streptomyces sp. SID4950]SCE38997.1 methoxymalonate biosynthesis acyl carrier protein [Streptomyces sp. SolWspMP-5a-2]